MMLRVVMSITLHARATVARPVPGDDRAIDSVAGQSQCRAPELDTRLHSGANEGTTRRPAACRDTRSNGNLHQWRERRMAARKSARKAVKKSAKKAVKKSAKKVAKTSATKVAKTSARTSSGKAGKPVDPGSAPAARARSAAVATPSASELDARDRLKSGPRRPAGPPLVGDILSATALAALRTERLPRPTNPKPAPEEN
jgi:hypothetical protein